jgi:head-tail adaptor
MGAGAFDKQITLLKRAPGRDPLFNTPDGLWVPFAKDIFASLVDSLPSRSERLAEGISIASRPARMRIRYREGVTSDMRVQYGSRILQIVAGPAELGRRDRLEFMVEEIEPMGDPA